MSQSYWVLRLHGPLSISGSKAQDIALKIIWLHFNSMILLYSCIIKLRYISWIIQSKSTVQDPTPTPSLRIPHSQPEELSFSRFTIQEFAAQISYEVQERAS